MKRINFLLPESDYEKLRKLSFIQRRKMSRIVRELVQEYLKQQ